jgi:hypothetical protein
VQRLGEMLGIYWVTWLAKVRSSDIGPEMYGRFGESLSESFSEKIGEMFGENLRGSWEVGSPAKNLSVG